MYKDAFTNPSRAPYGKKKWIFWPFMYSARPAPVRFHGRWVNFNHHTGTGVSKSLLPILLAFSSKRQPINNPFKTWWVAYLKGPARIPTGHRAIIFADFRKYIQKVPNGIHGCRPAAVRWPRGPLKGPGW